MENKLIATKAAMAAAASAVLSFLGWKGALGLAWILVMTRDYLSGTVAAMKEGEWASGKAREGLAHKGGMIFVVVVAGISDWIMALILPNIPGLGIQWPGLVLPLVLAWYILTELGSILENAVKLGAPVPPWLIKILKISKDAVEHAGDKTETPEST